MRWGFLAAAVVSAWCATAAVLARAAPSGPAATRVAFFGSSTTQGYGTSASEHRWSSRISRQFGWEELNFGLGRSTLTPGIVEGVPSGLERWQETLVAARPDVVVLQYGANDVLANVPVGKSDHPGSFAHAVDTLLKGIRTSLPDAAIVVVSPQPAELLDGRRLPYDRALSEAARRFGLRYLDGREAFGPDAYPALSTDALHLNDRGHERFAAWVLERLTPETLAVSGHEDS